MQPRAHGALPSNFPWHGSGLTNSLHLHEGHDGARGVNLVDGAFWLQAAALGTEKQTNNKRGRLKKMNCLSGFCFKQRG